ncbi:MAG: decaprenyl-phosphate phosphoribosyltransferase [Melioribacteraceae bacterium]|nr:decaprenyl-phosphate phosphoribosyltransferase [Melioribacteraceae bacterium]MDD3559233.1 decaprenyl-phosphate phosphoribosyltransferase [Melioribacteraceae bacterium]
MIKEIVSLIRVKDWIKNSFVFVALLFSKHLLDAGYFINVLEAFLIFSLASSFIYVINDILDIEFDKAHPIKKSRPLASGKISIVTAWIIAFVLILITIPLLINTNSAFIKIVSAYVLLNIVYSLLLKKIVILDLLSIAAGFTLRVVGGAAAISVAVSNWLLLTTLFISLFLAVMKRRSEIGLMEESNNSTRSVLQNYSIKFTDQIGTISAAGVIICYALYAVSDRTVQYFNTDSFIYTTVFVVFGIFRYMFLVHIRKQGENTVELLLKDFPMLINIFLYIISIVVLIYNSDLL